MKENFIFLVLLFLIPFSSHPQSSDRMHFNLRRKTIPEILEIIQSNTGYRFFYGPDLFPPGKKADLITSPHTSINTIMEKLLGNLDLTWQITDKGAVFIKALAKKDIDITVSGTVFDPSGQPVPAATVVVKGEKSGSTLTDSNGSYQINSKKNAMLIFSHIGFKNVEIPVDNLQTDVHFEGESKTLSEVVVVGYGKQKEITRIGSISSLNHQEIEATPSASLQNMLSGKITGLFSQQQSGMPGKDATKMYVRGISTFTGNVSPLVLVDNFEYPYEKLSLLDPGEVENVTVLKDAVSTAIYGVRAANGVILVTTRRGKKSAPVFEFRSEYGIQQPTHVPEFLNAYETALLLNESIANDNLTRGTSVAPEFSQADLNLFRNGLDPYAHPDINWYKTLFRSFAPVFKNRLGISGGTEQVKYYLLMGFLNQQGMLRNFSPENDVNTNYFNNRYNFRSNIDLKASKSLSFKFDFSGTLSTRNNPYFDGASGAGEVAAFAEVFSYEHLSPYMYAIRNPDQSFAYSSPSRAPSGSKPNIIGRLTYGGYRRTKENTLNLNTVVTQKLNDIIRGLEVSGAFSILSMNSAEKELVRRNFPSFFFDPTTGIYHPRDPNIFRVDPWSKSYQPGSPAYQLNLRTSATYTTRLKKHFFQFLALYNQSSFTGPAINLADNYIPSNFRGLTFRSEYNFDERYLLEISGALNGTDRFAPGRRYGLFPAFAAGWNIASEKFFQNTFPSVSKLKIRSSFGITGSEDPGSGNYYLYRDSYVRTSQYSFGETHQAYTGIAEGSTGNKGLTWQKERKLNIGVDIAVADGKISGTAEYFNNFRYDILTVRSTIAPHSGITAIPSANIGKVSNHGLELQLNYILKAGKTLITPKASYSYAANEIREIDEPQVSYFWQRQTGKSVGLIKQWIFEGFYQPEEISDPDVARPAGQVGAGYLKYRDLNEDGKIDFDDMAYLGNPGLPTHRFSLGLGFKWKNFSADLLLQADTGFDFHVGQDLSTPWKVNLQTFHLNRWTTENQAYAEFPALTKNFAGSYMSSDNPSTFWAIPGDYLRLRSFQINYSFPERWVTKAGLNKASFFINGYNIFSWSASFKRFQLDPEVASGSNNGTYPQQRIFNTGVIINW
ncbi:SusC/RagA family TonB-linked outer membrane protein [Desertivirga xinjiangensis]|uniref:SusC/RagA family TonB-linked outer membrane protein n=1 Tax=Desertivirga xinjiangensis TaxID=539206 RepID=UPI00210E6D69|nr:TonB-dependent receptor [Pedobacter xinjiangensis]